MKTVFKILMLLIVAGFLIYSFVGVEEKTEDILCTGMELEIRDSLQLGLITETQIREVIQKNHITFDGKKISDINMGAIEHTLSQSPYIDTVKCDLTSASKVHMTVYTMIPALHVMANNGDEYYLDRRGSTMPVGSIQGNLIIATGNITKEYAKQELSNFARFIQDNDYWHEQIQQIHVVKPTDVRLYTRIADHTVLLGNLDNLEDKLNNLKVFYEKGLPVTGWNKYTAIDVAYKDIVVGKRKDGKKKPIYQAPAPVATETPAQPNAENAAAAGNTEQNNNQAQQNNTPAKPNTNQPQQ